MSASRGSAGGDEKREGGGVGGIMRPGFKISLTQKQLEYVRHHLQFIHYVWFVTCLYQIFVPHRLTQGILETIIENYFK